ncbi:MAG: hypothetical protein ACE37K_12510 [Planctomycetota bacterium]
MNRTRRLHPARCARLVLLAAAALAACSTPTPAPPPGPNEGPFENGPPQPRIAADDRSQMLPLPNGLATYLQTGPVGSPAQIQFGVFAGSLFVSPGLAELAAQTLLRSTDPTTGTRSLEQRIRQLGGTVDVRIGLMTTWFDVRVRAAQTKKALQALRESLETVTHSRSQIERMRDELVARCTAEVLDDPVAATTRMLLQAERSTARHIDHLLDLDPSEVTLFHSRLYRPERCILTLRTPRRLDLALAEVTAGDASIDKWAPPPAVPGDSSPVARAFAPGLYWGEQQQAKGTTCSIVMRLPDATTPGAAEWLVMHSCLTLDGTGGRLEQLQDEAGLSHLRWESRVEHTPDVTALVLTTVAQPAEVTSLWRVYQRARQSLLAVPPSRSELQLALRRAQLNAGLSTLRASDHLRLDANLKMRNIRADALEGRLAAMADPSTWEPQQAARTFLATPAWMVAVGPQRPDDFAAIDGAIAIDLLPAGFDPKTQNQPTPENLATVDPWLVQARAATGGEGAYAVMKGFTARARVTSAQGLAADDTVDWAIGGALTRSRALVGQTITTTLADDGGFEELDGVRQSLTAREVRLLRHEMMRHPQMLLAAHQRGERRFRPVAQRKLGDREFYIVESVGDEFDRLRLHIDAESQLIRVVESWERLADDTLVHVREEWSDYHNAGGLRVPHRRRTTWNDGQHQSETVFSEWAPK